MPCPGECRSAARPDISHDPRFSHRGVKAFLKPQVAIFHRNEKVPENGNGATPGRSGAVAFSVAWRE